MWLFENPVAHRGLHDEKHTENSMSAFRLAIDAGFIIETDVHLLKSGEVVVFHDNDLKRVCNKNVKISDLTLEDIKGENYLLPNGEHIPLFSEFLELVDGKVDVLLELKLNGMNYGLEEAVYELIKGKENYIAVQSFNPFTVAWFANHAPEFTRGILSTKGLLTGDKLMRKKMQPHFLSYDIKYLTPKIMDYAHQNNMNVLSWTIRTPDLLDKALSLGVNNIIYERLNLTELNFDMAKLAKIPD